MMLRPTVAERMSLYMDRPTTVSLQDKVTRFDIVRHATGELSTGDGGSCDLFQYKYGQHPSAPEIPYASPEKNDPRHSNQCPEIRLQQLVQCGEESRIPSE